MSQAADRIAPLPRDEIVATIERDGPSRIPLVRAKWWGEGFVEAHGPALRPLEERFPEDVALFVDIQGLQPWNADLSWYREEAMAGRGKDAGILDDWAHLDEFLAKFPDPADPARLGRLPEQAAAAREAGRYVLVGWWRLFFERPWGIRGMQNLLTDYYLHPDEVHRLNRGLSDHYRAVLEHAIEACRPDGFWTSDDLGHQTQLMMRPEQFREFILPYYREIGDFLRDHNMHFWLHSCGNNTEILGDLADAGVDVFHPVQKHTMDEARVAEAFGDRLTFLAGIDVQHVLQERTPEEVRAEVRFLVDTFDREDGGMMLAAGNGIVPGTPLANVEAFLDEAVRYGAEHRASWR
jgi:uroporphyrinogen decarboxylase